MPHSIPDNFLALDGRYADYPSARFAVLPIPYDATTSFGVGTREGPRAILSASQQVELYDERLGWGGYTAGVATLPPLEVDARGPEQMVQRVYAAARPIVKDGKFLIALGGEHSITSGLVRAVKTRYKQLSVLQIDAHADLRAEYQGTPYSHASVMRRIHDLGVPAVGVGVRNFSAEEARFIRKENKVIISPTWVREAADTKGAPSIKGDPGAAWIRSVLDALTDEVYVTIDIDGFDPAYAPGTGTPEPGGLDWFQVTEMLAEVAGRKQIVAADCTEVRPIPPNTVTEFLAAKLLYRLIGLVTRP